MKTIGLLGGMSWESSIEYERLINEEVRRRLGGMHSADLLIRSYDFAAIEHMQSTGAWDEAAALLAGDATRLVAAGADLIVLCTNTMHRVADAIVQAIDVPFIHLADTTATAVRRAGLVSVGLLGTRFTMEGSFYRDHLSGAGLSVVVPDMRDRRTVDRIIFDELVRGHIDDRSRRSYLAVIDRLVEQGAQGIIAGCTEIELLVTRDDVDVPFFPTTRLHALAAVEAALAGDEETV